MSRYIEPHIENLLDALGGGRATSATQTTVTASTSSQSLLAANADRRGATFHNDSASDLYIRLNASAASTTAFTDKLSQGDYYEVPYHYTGAITGIWASATGAARVTEFT